MRWFPGNVPLWGGPHRQSIIAPRIPAPRIPTPHPCPASLTLIPASCLPAPRIPAPHPGFTHPCPLHPGHTRRAWRATLVGQTCLSESPRLEASSAFLLMVM